MHTSRSIMPAVAAVTTAAALAVLGAAPVNAEPPHATPPGPSAGNGQAELAQVRAATAAYHDLEAAIADEYIRASECVPNMGYHYQRSIATTAADLDPLAPEILVYAPQAGGGMRLVAVEYAAWDSAAALFGVPFDAPHPAGGPPFHTLHAWIWQANPDGMFDPTNPNVNCR